MKGVLANDMDDKDYGSREVQRIFQIRLFISVAINSPKLGQFCKQAIIGKC